MSLAGCGSDSTGPDDGPLPAGLTLALQPFVTSGLASPVFLAQPLNDGRIFVVEKAGQIRVVRDGILLPTPFLDIRPKVADDGERGLLSIAFHPQYATNKLFFIFFTYVTGDIRIEGYTASANPDVADPAFKPILTIPHPVSNHNGGLLAFGPDGMLYAGIGDGGSGQAANAQDFNSLLGSMLRIDVNTAAPYVIPPDNPYVGVSGRRGEIWAKGLRNPWRWSIDAPTEILYIADVGQDIYEEVNAQPYTVRGLNYGWNRMEGLSCFPPGNSTCSRDGLILPLFDYPQPVAGCASVTGGYVYRGSEIDGLQGHYLYSDYCNRWLRSFRYSNGAAVDTKDWNIVAPGGVTSFGVDLAGEIYIIADPGIYRIVEGS